MRNGVRRIGFVGVPDRSVAESLREYGYRVDGIGGEGIIGLAGDLYRMRPAVIHARADHLKAALVARLLDVPLLIQVSCEDIGPLTVRAVRMASRTLCGGAAVREALIAQGAPASGTCVLCSLLDVQGDARAAAVFPPMLDPALRWVVAASPCDGPERGRRRRSSTRRRHRSSAPRRAAARPRRRSPSPSRSRSRRRRRAPRPPRLRRRRPR